MVVGTVPLRTRPPQYRAPDEGTRSSAESRIVFYPQPAPPYNGATDGSANERKFCPQIEHDQQSVILYLAPPTYAECINGSVDIGDDEDGEMMGDTRYTPMYAYVQDYNYQPPPAYSEVC